MDFTLDEVQQDVSDLAGRILTDRVTPERLMALDEETDYIDRDVWKQFADAGLLGLALPDDVGGSGYGLVELCAILEQVGRHVAPIPLTATVAMAAMPINRFGSPDQRAHWLPGVVDGTTILTAALEEPFLGDVIAPRTTATADGGDWVLDGEKIAVPYGPLADAILVPAAAGDGTVGVFIVRSDTEGLVIEPAESTSGEPQARLLLDGVRVGAVDVLGDPAAGTEMIDWMQEHAIAAIVATGVGVLDRSVAMTADYISQREQFGRPIATFQGATLRIADAFIDVEAIRVTAWSAIWRLAVGRPARDELAIAKFWLADGGQRASGACQHLHGGMGATTDYPIHRYFKASKQLEHMLGGSTVHLLRLGASMAGETG